MRGVASTQQGPRGRGVCRDGHGMTRGAFACKEAETARSASPTARDKHEKTEVTAEGDP